MYEDQIHLSFLKTQCYLFTLTWCLLMSLTQDFWDGEDSGRHAGGLFVAGWQHPDCVSVRVHQLPGHQQPLHPQKSPESETC